MSYQQFFGIWSFYSSVSIVHIPILIFLTYFLSFSKYLKYLSRIIDERESLDLYGKQCYISLSHCFMHLKLTKFGGKSYYLIAYKLKLLICNFLIVEDFLMTCLVEKYNSQFCFEYCNFQCMLYHLIYIKYCFIFSSIIHAHKKYIDF